MSRLDAGEYAPAQEGRALNAAYISALAALAGSAIGALASFATTWLTQRYQKRAQRVAAETTRRAKLFSDFIDLASRLFADALTQGMDDPTTLVPLYAVISRMWLFASPNTIRAAEGVMTRIVDVYYSPKVKLLHHADVDQGALDPLRDFTDACRNELLR